MTPNDEAEALAVLTMYMMRNTQPPTRHRVMELAGCTRRQAEYLIRSAEKRAAARLARMISDLPRVA